MSDDFHTFEDIWQILLANAKLSETNCEALFQTQNVFNYEVYPCSAILPERVISFFVKQKSVSSYFYNLVVWDQLWNFTFNLINTFGY